jgi:putative ABC transport system permease protein
MAYFTTRKRIKEIGIRKVYGATTTGILVLLAKEFTRWVIVSNMLAWPVAYIAMRYWLQNFAYQIKINIGAFILTGIFAFMIAGLTVLYQTLKAARANPVNALRYE